MTRRPVRYGSLPTERTLPAAARLDEMSARQVVALMAAEERRSAAAVAKAAPAIARVAEAVAQAFAAGGRLIYVGAGTSGRLAALDAAECPPTFGTRPAQVVAVVAGGGRALRRAVEGAEDRGEDAWRALTRLRLSARDVVVGVAASGVTPFARAALEAARAAGAATAIVTCAPRAARGAADVVIGLEVGAEVLSGSTRLKAGSATKMALNAISTAAMVRAGKCYGPLMVNLRIGSNKLAARARRIVEALTDVRGDAVESLLAEAKGRVKVAVVMARLGVDRRRAEALLVRAGGRLRRALG